MSARRSQAALAIARKKNRAQASSSSVQYHAPTRVTVAGYSAQDDSVNFMQIDPEAAAEPVNDIWNRFKKKDKINLLMIKTLDLLLSLYIVGYISYSIYLNSILLLSRETITRARTDDLNVKNDSSLDWFNSNLTVLGKERWSMNYAHFTLIITIFHVVYGIIAATCDLMFFHAFINDNVTVRYLETVLPVHRLFFLVITSIDGLIFMFTGNISQLIDSVFAVFLVIIIGLVVISDGLLMLVSREAVKGRPGVMFTKPWRNLVMLVTILTTVIFLLSQLVLYHYEEFTWDTAPIILFSFVSIIMIIIVIFANIKNVNNNNNQDDVRSVKNILYFLMSISSSNVLGLFAIGTVVHRLIFYYSTSLLNTL